MLLSIAADERAEMHFADLASALDAGLPIAALGGDPQAGDRALHAALRRRGVQPTPTEDVVLAHAWRAGKATAALRACAAGRRRRADFARSLWTGLRYPLLLAVLLLAAAIVAARFVGPNARIVVGASLAATAAAAALLYRGVRAGAPWVRRLPGTAALLDGLAELPYLETLHGLYGAGVPLLQAHAAAADVVPAGELSARARIADGILRQGRPLQEALAAAAALHPETRMLLATGEQSGQLEDALARALARRRDAVGRGLSTLARRVGQIAYVAAMLGVAALVVQFYSGYFAGLRAALGNR